MQKLFGLVMLLLAVTGCASEVVESEPVGSITFPPLEIGEEPSDFAVWREDDAADSVVLHADGLFEWSMQLRFDATVDIVLKSVKLKDVGNGSFKDIKLLYLYNGEQSYLAGTPDPDTQTFGFEALDLYVAADTEAVAYYSVYVLYDAPPSSVGNTHQFELESAEAISLDTKAEVIGDFPIVGVSHTLAKP